MCLAPGDQTQDKNVTHQDSEPDKRVHSTAQAIMAQVKHLPWVGKEKKTPDRARSLNNFTLATAEDKLAK